MAGNLRLDTSLDLEDQREYQQLLLQRQNLDAKIATFQLKSSPIRKHQHQRHHSHVPRSLSSNGVPGTSRPLSSDQIEVPSTLRRASSQRSAPSMARNGSRNSSQRTGNLPFISNGGPMPPPLHVEIRRDNPPMTAWTPQDEPLSEYTLSHQSSNLHRPTPQLEQVPEMEDPVEFLLRRKHPNSIASFSLNHRLPTNSYNLQIPSTPTSDSLTTATTLTSMSRTNSLCNDAMLEGIQMMRFNSNVSFANDDQLNNDQNNPFTSSLHSRRSSTEEQSQLLTGAGGASSVPQFSSSFHVTSSTFSGEKMEKSQSNESTSSSLSSSSSSSSSSSRNIKRLQEQNNSAVARPLMPKGGSEEMSRGNSSQDMSRLGSKDGSDKVAISKPTYTRPKHDRVHCKQCDAHPEGFRGEHELRRHQDREHKQMVKKFICIEPTDGRNHPKPILPLSKCKACNQQKKKYNAYYNAAAHLRRAHFKPKLPKGRSKQSKMDNDEKRGGKGGGDWPDMKELKHWMKEVEEAASDFQLTNAEQEEEDASEDEDSTDPIDEYLSRPTISSNNYDNGFLPDAPMMNAYSINLTNNDLSGIQMPLDLSGAQQSHCMDSSMYTSAAQSFSSFPTDPYQTDPLMGYFVDSSVPIFSVEQDFANNFPPNSYQ